MSQIHLKNFEEDWIGEVVETPEGGALITIIHRQVHRFTDRDFNEMTDREIAAFIASKQ